jgi:hypothetical protein
MYEYEALLGLYWRRKAEILEEKSGPVPLCPPQIPRAIFWDEIRASTATDGGRDTAITGVTNLWLLLAG